MSQIYLVTGQKQLFDNETYKIIGVEESLKLLSPLKIVGLDTETEGFSPFLKKLLMLQLGNRDFQVVVDCTTIDVQLYKEYLESERLFIGWNLKFDVKFLFYHNIIPRNLYDGFLAEKMRWLGWPSGMHSLSLKSAGENYLGVELDKTVRGQIIWKKELTDEIVEYAANDVKYLEDIMNKQTEILYARGQKLALEVENKAILPTAYFEFCGVKIDIDRWQAKMKKDEEALQKAQDELDEFVVGLYETNKSNLSGFWVDDWYDFSNGSPNGKWRPAVKTEGTPEAPPSDKTGGDWQYISREFPFIEIAQPDLFGFTTPGPKCKVNWNSSRQVIPLLEFFGFDLLTKDKVNGGMKKSVDATVIEGQKDKHPIADVYLRFKAAQKVTSTYGQNFLDLINPKTGRIHTSFNQIGTDTHRYSSGGGDDKEVIPGKKVPLVNLQNLPADAETRACFISENGNKWISADYSGEESVILANIAKDKAMIELFLHGCGDLHSLVAKMVYPDELKDVPVEKVKKLRPDLRKKAKAPEFTFAYGGDANTLIGRDHIPEEEARAIENNYKKGFPGVAAYQSYQRKVVMQLGYINTCPEVGFRAHIYDFEELDKTQKKFCQEFWTKYRNLKATNPSDPLVEEVRYYFKRKSASERQSINYPIQSRGSAIFKICAVNLFNWVVKNNLFGKVKFCIPAHDEFNIEAPAEIAEEVANKLHECMVNAGKFICKIGPLEAEVSRLKDGTLPTYWIH
jgi:DNA polymerase I-like protein with 3'-5' exonuclease and polymerase domains